MKSSSGLYSYTSLWSFKITQENRSQNRGILQSFALGIISDRIDSIGNKELVITSMGSFCGRHEGCASYKQSL